MIRTITVAHELTKRDLLPGWGGPVYLGIGDEVVELLAVDGYVLYVRDVE